LSSLYHYFGFINALNKKGLFLSTQENKLSEREEKERVFTCPNPSCRRVFAAPLRTLNLQHDSKERYNACPYCLTRIEEEPMKRKSTSEEDVFKELPIYNEGIVEAKRTSESNVKQPICNYHLGYLSERTQNEQIPEECLVCQNTVECMLRKMRQ
jgi:hypothetical protein